MTILIKKYVLYTPYTVLTFKRVLPNILKIYEISYLHFSHAKILFNFLNHKVAASVV